ncbi:MAG TPA: Clp protease N-terminal domain-containing protein [Gemmataceae bacterium]|nr:Clp protease N-terminal domain-containing protein [Gemmataceae bacterium]
MYERFTDRARKVMQLANQEAQRLNHEYIGTEHILLGLIKEGSGVAANVLKNLDIDLRKIRLEVEKIIQSGPDTVTMGKLPQTPRAKKVIEYAIEEARNLNHNYVGTEHLLLGLLREQEGVAAQVLMDLGLVLKDVREEVLNLLGHPSPPQVKDSRAELRDLPPETLKAVAELDAEIERLNRKKEAAVAEMNFEEAAHLRDQIDKLKRQRQNLIGAVSQKANESKQGEADPPENHKAGDRTEAERLRQVREQCSRLDDLEKQLRDVEGQLRTVRFLLGGLVGTLIGILLGASLGAILGLIVGCALAALGRFIPVAIAGGITGALLGDRYLADGWGEVVGAILGALLAACLVELGRRPGGKRWFDTRTLKSCRSSFGSRPRKNARHCPFS